MIRFRLAIAAAVSLTGCAVTINNPTTSLGGKAAPAARATAKPAPDAPADGASGDEADEAGDTVGVANDRPAATPTATPALVAPTATPGAAATAFAFPKSVLPPLPSALSTLIGTDGASLVGADGASLVGAGAGNLIGTDGASYRLRQLVFSDCELAYGDYITQNPDAVYLLTFVFKQVSDSVGMARQILDMVSAKVAAGQAVTGQMGTSLYWERRGEGAAIWFDVPLMGVRTAMLFETPNRGRYISRYNLGEAAMNQVIDFDLDAGESVMQAAISREGTRSYFRQSMKREADGTFVYRTLDRAVKTIKTAADPAFVCPPSVNMLVSRFGDGGDGAIRMARRTLDATPRLTWLVSSGGFTDQLVPETGYYISAAGKPLREGIPPALVDLLPTSADLPEVPATVPADDDALFALPERPEAKN